MDSQPTPAPTRYLAYTLKTDKSALELSAEAERLHPNDLSAQQRWLIEETSRIGWDVASGVETTAVLKPHNNLRAETESFLSEIGITDYSFTPIGDLQIHSIPDDWHYERSENLTDDQLTVLDLVHRLASFG